MDWNKLPQCGVETPHAAGAVQMLQNNQVNCAMCLFLQCSMS